MSWTETNFEELYEIPSKNGLTRPAHSRGRGYKMINMGELFAHDRISDLEMELVPMNQKELSTMLVESGDLLFARQSLVLSGAGKCSVVTKAEEPTTFESHIIRVRLKREIADPAFFHYYFKSPLCRIRSIVTQGVQAGIRGNDLKRLKVHVPPITEQQRIASILSAYDDLIENNRRRIQLLEQAARLLYKEWFVHLRFPGHEHTKIHNGIPNGWEAGTIGDLGEVVTGKTPSKKRPENYGHNVPFIKTPDMHGNAIVVYTEESLSEEGAKSQANKTLPPRSILVSCIGTVGTVAFNASAAQTNQQINSIVPACNLVIYWAYFMAKDLKPLLEGMGGGATMANVNKSKFSGIKIVIPSRQLLELFSDFAKPVFDQIETLTISIARLTKARDLLLPRLMNGELAV